MFGATIRVLGGVSGVVNIQVTAKTTIWNARRKYDKNAGNLAINAASPVNKRIIVA
jgi:hypothetical protein